ncbi:AGR137Wp [Eremothecium gossypii ATCC 10895]|uniref:AGR137Wp n=1 Tax=Eremothecium gossypii (strain ATCC 10895 / CBS 109.51 / FGSC 9923 / NRRL Y-1056) TaxID=284811 RepID=Q74ZR1_EREGS|nr:AGR137Wp [Eremothecium gossypii ATCC 10895]AAS54627.1 AGR137Wp [Eremothecium gossypii ATCC 10895]AEY98957.1 FAGR137Wp [Eremothecium gossypii FDAG1]
MSVGVSLSQLLQEGAEPLTTGIPQLDDALGAGLDPRSIYEVFGPPGIGKTLFGLQVIRCNRGKRVLVVDTHKRTPLDRLLPTEPSADDIEPHVVRLTKFAQLVYFFQELRTAYDLIIIEGLSQVLIDYLHGRMRHPMPSDTTLHGVKTRQLIALLSLLTRYVTQHHSCVLLLNDAMNTAYQDYSDHPLVAVDVDRGPFLVRAERRRHVQTLKSALVANASVGGKDAKWEVFVRCRIGLFWDWDRPAPGVPADRRVPPKIRIAVVLPLAASAAAHSVVKLKIDSSGALAALQSQVAASAAQPLEPDPTESRASTPAVQFPPSSLSAIAGTPTPTPPPLAARSETLTDAWLPNLAAGESATGLVTPTFEQDMQPAPRRCASEGPAHRELISSGPFVASHSQPTRPPSMLEKSRHPKKPKVAEHALRSTMAYEMNQRSEAEQNNCCGANHNVDQQDRTSGSPRERFSLSPAIIGERPATPDCEEGIVLTSVSCSARRESVVDDSEG